MKTITNNGMIRILPGNAGIADFLEPRPYQLLYDQNIGPFLVPASLQEASPIFGPMKGKEKKVFDAYDRHSSNTGIILSGEKGLGKSLFSRSLAHIAMERGMPIIMVDSRARDIATFIATLDQPTMFLLDEFEKHFKIRDLNGDEDTGGQLQFLSLLDGTDGAKRLVVITCNDTYDLSQFFLDRPGRFYYNLQFTYPGAEEAREFIRYCGLEGHDEEVQRLSSLGTLIGFSYDALRAIVEELKVGYSLDETLADLNVAGRCRDRYADIKVTFADGTLGEGYTNLDFDDEWSEDFRITSSNKTNNRSNKHYRAYDLGCMYIRINAMREDPEDPTHRRYTVHKPNDNVKWDWWDDEKLGIKDDSQPKIKDIEVLLRPTWTFKGGMNTAMHMFA